MDVVMRTFGLIFLQKTKASRVGKSGSDAFVGVGAFNLVRKSALDGSEGFQWLRMEVADDVGLGMMLQRSGAESGFAFAFEHLSVTWQPSIRAMVNCLERVGHYGFANIMLAFVFTWATFFAPVVAILASGTPCLWVFGFAAYLFTVVHAVVWRIKFRQLEQGLLASLFIPVGLLILSVMVLRSVILCRARGGIVWRGTKYATKDLRAGQRVKL